MNIYFAGSIRGGRADAEVYAQIIALLKGYGTVLTEHLGQQNITAASEQHENTAVYERDMAWLKQADVVVAEVSTPSLGVGYELGQAEALGKRVLCLYRHGAPFALSAMIRGNEFVTVEFYTTLDDISKILKDFLA